MIDYRAEAGILAGNLRHRVKYDVVAQGPPSEFGDSAEVWSTLATLWAEVTILDGRELMSAKLIHAEARARIIVRFNAAITSGGRFVFNGKNYYIASAIPDALKRVMNCTCFVRSQENV